MLKDQMIVMFESLALLVRHLKAKEDTEGLKLLSDYIKEFERVGDDAFELHNKMIDTLERINRNNEGN